MLVGMKGKNIQSLHTQGYMIFKRYDRGGGRRIGVKWKFYRGRVKYWKKLTSCKKSMYSTSLTIDCIWTKTIHDSGPLAHILSIDFRNEKDIVRGYNFAEYHADVYDR